MIMRHIDSIKTDEQSQKVLKKKSNILIFRDFNIITNRPVLFRQISFNKMRITGNLHCPLVGITHKFDD